MARDITSKNIDGITDLVVIAPIREGFINAYENITYATRLRIVAEALHRIRVSAREHEFTLPFSDTTERILTLLDFRVGVLDKDLFKLSAKGGGNAPVTHELKSTRYLYLTATFDGAWEPYMRLIWKPLGSFLDLLFCNCEGYVTAGDHDFPTYARWVRDHQMDSAIFYSTTGLTVKDALYLNRLDRLQREPGTTELDVVRMTMPDPEKVAEAVRIAATAAAAAADPRPMFKIHELALEALTVLFRLADFYPPEWLAGDGDGKLKEGRYLARVACDLLDGWDDKLLLPETQAAYREPLEWFQSAKAMRDEGTAPMVSAMPTPADPAFVASEVQGGMLHTQRIEGRPMQQGALLLMTIANTEGARDFVESLALHFADGDGASDDRGFFRTVAFTAEGLERMGVEPEVVDGFPKEFREGMAMRSGLLGDMRENHPRRWQLPARNWPPLRPDEAPRPPVELSEIDIVIQLRHASESADDDQAAALMAEIARIAAVAEASGVALAAVETMENIYDPQKRTSDHFGFRDGISQPDVMTAPAAGPKDNQVRLGELLCGYANDKGDYAAGPNDGAEQPEWRQEKLQQAAQLQKDGSYLVIRKLEQHDDVFEAFLKNESARISKELGITMTADDLGAKLVGRSRDGTALVQPAGADQNGFKYKDDAKGSKCPFAAHIRRTNPRKPFQESPNLRKPFQERPNPRIVRRGMSFGKPRTLDPTGKRGLMFMCYNSSIAEQFETIQRWINGGNSTDVSSGQNDPLMGVAPKTGDRVFRFEVGEGPDAKVVRVSLPRGANPEKPQAFVSLHWGMYLFVPSRSAIEKLCGTRRPYRDMGEALENQGREAIRLIESLPETQRRSEWKRLLEDFYAKDPAELDEMPHIWSAIRWYGGGSYRTEAGIASTPVTQPTLPKAFAAETEAALPTGTADTFRPTVLTASYDHAIKVLSDWKTYSVEEQLDRITKTSGSIYVTQQPDDDYDLSYLHAESNYREESFGTNEILFDYGEEAGFAVGYKAGKTVLGIARARAAALGLDYFKVELRRQYLMPALGLVCTDWFGIPDWDSFKYRPGEEAQAQTDRAAAIMVNGGWDWKRATDPANEDGPPLRKARCPGDCLSPSRDAFYPRPTPTISLFGHDHGHAIRKAGLAFVEQYLATDTEPPGFLPSHMFELFKAGKLTKDGFARNLIGIMVGAMPPMDGNLRGILVEWLGEKTLWRHQAALLRERGNDPLSFTAADAALRTAMSRAMCKRPAPDLIYRKARHDAELVASDGSRREVGAKDVHVKAGDQVIVSLVSVAQRSLVRDPEGPGDVSIIFGGKRECPWQGEYGLDDVGNPTVVPRLQVHACPAQKMAMGAMMGILAALLEAGRIQALPASLILKISDWPPI